jgi:hypothetical protein
MLSGRWLYFNLKTTKVNNDTAYKIFLAGDLQGAVVCIILIFSLSIFSFPYSEVLLFQGSKNFPKT